MTSIKVVLSFLSGCLLLGCARTIEWKEEVLFNDGRKLVVSQARTCAGGRTASKSMATCVATDATMSFHYAPLSSQEISWKGHLHPLVLNTDRGRLFLVGFPIHPSEFLEYGSPEPPYVGFVWNGRAWEQIAFGDIPPAIYTTNLLVESIPKTGRKYITLSLKDSAAENGDPTYPSYLKHVDPTHKKRSSQ